MFQKTNQLSFPREKIKILLLEGVHNSAVLALKGAGFAVEALKVGLTKEELLERIGDIHVLGIRSKTQVDAEILGKARRLLAVGCFGVGTNQVDLDAARGLGVPVFNAPYGNTRSVAELTLGMILSLARGLGDHNRKMHEGVWNKSAKGSIEVKGKVLGVIGYGHIGQQIGLLAEGIGMEVRFYDKIPRLPLGRSLPTSSMEALLEQSDFVTLHIPAAKSGEAVFNKHLISLMKKGSYLLNLSRGTLVDLEAIKEALNNGDLAGVGLDVFPNEPKGNDVEFITPLTGVAKVLLAPHQGGSTEEAQEKIGYEVTEKFIRFIDEGTSVGAVNFPAIDLPAFPESHRLLHIHRNVPGVMGEINQVIADCGANINAQYLSTFKDIGYLIVDLNQEFSDVVKRKLEELQSTVKLRVLF